jgi:hypothetical protein
MEFKKKTQEDVEFVSNKVANVRSILMKALLELGEDDVLSIHVDEIPYATVRSRVHDANDIRRRRGMAGWLITRGKYPHTEVMLVPKTSESEAG